MLAAIGDERVDYIEPGTGTAERAVKRYNVYAPRRDQRCALGSSVTWAIWIPRHCRTAENRSGSR